MRALSLPFKARHVVWIGTVAIVVIWIVYLSIGQQIISALYNSDDSWVANRLMAGKASTPVEAYHRRADAVLAHGTFVVAAVSIALWLVVRNAVKVSLLVISFLGSSFLLFYLLETFPSLVSLTHLDNVSGYYAFKANYISDPELVFREKPFNRRVIHRFTGTGYSPQYGIEVESYSIEWIMDKDGFRNQGAAEFADIVILGDSYLEYGSNEADTFVGRLEEKLPGLSVRNLGKSGYSVGQYLNALKRFGLPYKPKVALMAFYEGNDIPEVRDYLLWKSGRTSELRGYLFKFATDSLWRRYGAAVGGTWVELSKKFGALDEVLLNKFATVRGYAPKTHPDLAIVNLNGRLYPKLFIDKPPEMTIKAMLATEELQAIRRFFGEFREVCQNNGIAPLILYIPTALQVYAPYTTQASGKRWLDSHNRQMALRENTERAIKIVADESRLEVVSFTPLFQRAAAEGNMLYYALDAHWNAVGREIAARFIAEALIERNLIGAKAKVKRASQLREG